MSKAASVDRLPWDANGIDLRFQHYAPDLTPSARRWLVSACLNAPALGATPEDVFNSSRADLKKKPKPANRY